MKSTKRQKNRTLKAKLPKSAGATGDQWRANCRKNEETEPKQKQYPVVDVTGAASFQSVCPLMEKVKWLMETSS